MFFVHKLESPLLSDFCKRNPSQLLTFSIVINNNYYYYKINETDLIFNKINGKRIVTLGRSHQYLGK